MKLLDFKDEAACCFSLNERCGSSNGESILNVLVEILKVQTILKLLVNFTSKENLFIWNDMYYVALRHIFALVLKQHTC
jgi:hypothetical protein